MKNRLRNRLGKDDYRPAYEGLLKEWLRQVYHWNDIDFKRMLRLGWQNRMWTIHHKNIRIWEATRAAQEQVTE